MGESRWSFGSMMPADSSAESAESEPVLQAGARFGEFELLSEIGRGGMGVVYRAKDASGREVALKLLSRKLSPSTRQRLDREGEVTAALNHPGIVRIHSAGEIDGRPYLAYELVEGAHNLDVALEKAERTERVRLLRDTARALGAAHAQGIVHRDVKPENVLVGSNGDPRVVDFGLAWAEELDQLTRSGTLLGTPMYMAPEQLVGDREQIGPPTDVWALGILLYQSLTGQHPFDAGTLVELRMRVCQGDPPLPRKIDPSVPGDLEAICLKALALRPVERYANADAFADDLDNALASRPVSASSISRLQLWRLSRSPRVRAAAMAALALAVVLALGAGWLWTTRTARHERKVRGLLETSADIETLTAALDSTMSDSLRAEVHVVLAERAAATDTTAQLEHASRALSLAPRNGRARAQRGLALLALGRPAEAAEALKEALEVGQPATLRAPLTRALLDANRPQDAAAACAVLLESRPDDVALLRLQVEAQVRSGRTERAEATIQRLTAHAPGPSVGVLRAELALHTGADPQPFLYEATEKWPQDPYPIATHVQLLLGRDEAAAALHLLEESAAAGRDPALLALTKRLTALTRDLDTTPLAAAPLAERRAAARWLLREGRRELALIERAGQPDLRSARPAVVERRARARQALDSALGLAPTPELSARIHLQLARLQGPKSPKGLEHLRAIGEELSTSTLGRRLWVERHLASGAPRKALALLADLPSDQEADPWLALLRGKAFLALGQFADALPHLERADPESLNAKTCGLRVEALRGARRKAEAAELEERILRLGGARSAEALSYYEEDLTAEFVRTQAPRERISLYNKAIALDPLDSRYRAALGKATVSHGEQRNGFMMMAEVISRDPAYLVKALRAMHQIAINIAQFNGQGALGRMFERVPLQRERGLEQRLWGYMNGFRAELEGAGVEAATPGLVALDAALERDPAEITAYVMRALLHLRAGHLAQAERDLEIAADAAPDCAPVAMYRALLAAKRGRSAAAVARHLEDSMQLGYRNWLTDSWDPTTYPELEPYLRRTEVEAVVGPVEREAALVQIGPYQVVSELGRGAMGAVYLARDPAARRDVALKLITGELTEKRRQRFRREAELTAKLDHPGIVRVHNAGEDDQGRPWIAFELVEGARPLRDLLPELELERRMRLIQEAAEALGHAHAQGIVHRDVKPDNLLIDGGGRVRVADFGVATARDVERLTLTGAWVGTPTHMAPEQFKDSMSVGPAADVWALGVVLYEALSGELPFSVVNAGELVTAIQRGAPAITDPAVPRGLRAVCARALETDPSARFADGSALADALADALEHPTRASLSPLTLTGIVLALATVLLLTLLVLGPGSADPEGAPQENAPSAPADRAPRRPPRPPPLSASQHEEAMRELRVLRKLEDPRILGEKATAWLRAYPGHFRSEEVRGLRSKARISAPLASVDVEFVGRRGRNATSVTARFLDGRRVAAIIYGDEVVHLWRWSDERLSPAPPWRPEGRVVRLESPGDGSLFVLRVEGPGHLLRLGSDSRPQVIRFAGAGPTWNPDTGLEAWHLTVQPSQADPSLGTAVALSLGPREVWVLRIDADGLARTVLRTQLPEGEVVRVLALSPDGGHLLIGSSADDDGDTPGTARLHSLPDGTLVRSLSLQSNLVDATLTNDRLAIATVWGQIWQGPLRGPWELLRDSDFERKHPNLLARSHLGACREVAFSPDGRHLLSTSLQPQTDVFNAGPGEGNELRGWSVGEEPALTHRTETTPLSPHSFDLDPSGRYALIGSRDRQLVVYATR